MGVIKEAKVHYNDYFVNMIMEIVAQKLEDESSKIYINQHQAHKRFGRGNVERWVKLQRIKAFYRGNTVQYRMKELLAAASNQQDYLYQV